MRPAASHRSADMTPKPSALRNNTNSLAFDFRLRKQQPGDINHLIDGIRQYDIGLAADRPKHGVTSGKRARVRHGRIRADGPRASLEKDDRFRRSISAGSSR